MVIIKYLRKHKLIRIMKIKMFLQKFSHPIVAIRDGNDPDQCRRLTLFDAFQVVVNDKNVPFLNLISCHKMLSSYVILLHTDQEKNWLRNGIAVM